MKSIRIVQIWLLFFGVILVYFNTLAVEKKPVPAPANQQANEQISWVVIASGGSVQSSSTQYHLGLTVGQTFVGQSGSPGYNVNLGFWQDFGQGGCCVNRGNVDGVIGPFGPIDVADITYLVAFLWQGGPEPSCLEEGNVDGVTGTSGPVTVTDLTYLISFVWQGGQPPPPCP